MTFLAWNIDDRSGRGNKDWSIIFRFVYQFWNWTRFWMLRIILPKICDEFFYLWYKCLLAHIQWATKTCLSWTWTLKLMEVDGSWWWLMVVEFLGIVNAPERNTLTTQLSTHNIHTFYIIQIDLFGGKILVGIVFPNKYTIFDDCRLRIEWILIHIFLLVKNNTYYTINTEQFERNTDRYMR